MSLSTKALIELADQLHALVDLVAFELQGRGDLAAVEGGIARRRIDRQRDDLVGRVVRHLLDVHAAFGGDDEGDARGGAVDQRRQIELAADVAAVLDEQALDGAAGRPGLDRHQRLAQHLLGDGLHLVDGLGESHAALVAGVGLLELALAAAAGVDLRLHHPDRAGQRLRGGHRFLRREGRRALRHRHAILAQQLLGLILVDVHGS